MLHSLNSLTRGRPADFQPYDRPPPELRKWLERADPKQVRGLMIVTLRRWHELEQT